MTVQRHDRPSPPIERTFTAVRAALPAASAGGFDAELAAITSTPVADLAALDEFLSAWWRIATRAAADPADWQRMHQEAEELQAGTRPAGPTLAEVPGRRGMRLRNLLVEGARSAPAGPADPSYFAALRDSIRG
jgi:hypothetical protein